MNSNKITKIKAAKLLRPLINKPARTISRTFKKKAIEDKLADFNIHININ